MGKEQDLLAAARDADMPTLRRLLPDPKNSKSKRSSSLFGKPLNVNCQDESGYTPLHHAALKGHTEVVTTLLDNNVVVNAIDNKESTPLHVAAWSGREAVVKQLIEAGVDVNKQAMNGETALHPASQNGYKNIVKMLLAARANIYLRTKSGETALDLAAQYGREGCVRVLLGGDPDVPISAIDMQQLCSMQHTPLHLASRNGHVHVVKLLLQFGMDINVKTSKGTPLHEAALFGKTEVVRTLISHGADATIRNSANQTALDVLNSFFKGDKGKEIRELLTGSAAKQVMDAPEVTKDGSQSVLVRAVMDYSPSAYDDQALEFKRGDLVTVLEQRKSGLWTGRANGLVGVFPSTYVTSVTEEEAHELETAAAAAGETVSRNSAMDLEQKRAEAVDALNMTPLPASVYSTSSHYGSESLPAPPGGDGDEDIYDTIVETVPEPLPSDIPATGPNPVSMMSSSPPAVSSMSGAMRGSPTLSTGSYQKSADDPLPPVPGGEDPMAEPDYDDTPAPLPEPASYDTLTPSSAAGAASFPSDPASSSSASPSAVPSSPESSGGAGKKARARLLVFLSTLKLEKLTDDFIAQGWDSKEFLVCITADDLDGVGVTMPGHKKKVLLQVQKLPDPFVGLTADLPLSEWLERIALSQYLSNFESNGFDDIESILEMVEEEIAAIDVSRPGHRRRVLAAIQACRGDAGVAASQPAPPVPLPQRTSPPSRPSSQQARPASAMARSPEMARLDMQERKQQMLSEARERAGYTRPKSVSQTSNVEQIGAKSRFMDALTQMDDSEPVTGRMDHMDPNRMGSPGGRPAMAPLPAHADLRPDAQKVRADSAMREIKLQAFEKYRVKYLGAGQIPKKAGKAEVIECMRMIKLKGYLNTANVQDGVFAIFENGIKYVNATAQSVMDIPINRIAYCTRDPQYPRLFGMTCAERGHATHFVCHVFDTSDSKKAVTTLSAVCKAVFSKFVAETDRAIGADKVEKEAQLKRVEQAQKDFAREHTSSSTAAAQMDQDIDDIINTL